MCVVDIFSLSSEYFIKQERPSLHLSYHYPTTHMHTDVVKPAEIIASGTGEFFCYFILSTHRAAKEVVKYHNIWIL